MRYAILNDQNEVINVIEAPDNWVTDPKVVRDTGGTAHIGGTYIGGVFIPPVYAPLPSKPRLEVRATDAFRALVVLLVSKGVLTAQEAKDLRDSLL